MSISKTTIKRLAIMQEANVRECRICKEKKLRILHSRFPKGNNKYIGECGKLWCGRVCPPCNNKRIKDRMASLRKGHKTKLGTELIESLTEAVNAETISKTITEQEKK